MGGREGLVISCNESGKSKAALSPANSLNYHQFLYWCTKLNNKTHPLIPVRITNANEPLVNGVNDSKGFLNAKAKGTFTLNDRDDADYFSKALGQKTITVTNKGFSSVGSQSILIDTKNLITQSQLTNEPRILNDTL